MCGMGTRVFIGGEKVLGWGTGVEKGGRGGGGY